MNITAINEAIKELESSDTTIDNVQELANLYIVRNYLSQSLSSNQTPEFPNILPSYQNYCEIKSGYQRGQIPEESVVDAAELLCQELTHFIQTLYCNTDLRKERMAIESVLSTQYNQFCNS